MLRRERSRCHILHTGFEFGLPGSLVAGVKRLAVIDPDRNHQPATRTHVELQPTIASARREPG